MRPTVYLFDVDGTLIRTDGAGRRALLRTFGRVFGREDAFDAFRFGGMTDRAIVRAGLLAIDIEPTEERIDEILVSYLEVLVREVANARVYQTHTGMLEALDAIDETPHALGLGTGNIREGARIKLSRVELFERFSFGGFGSDAEDRNELIRVGAQRGAEQLGVPLEECRVVIVGDTPKDVEAAQALGGESVAVATGSFALEALVEAGATWAFDSLGAPGALEALLGE